MSNREWHNTLAACYGHRFKTEGEQDTFYDIVNEATGAKGSEICDAVLFASRAEIRLKGQKAQYGNVETNDVISWVFEMRDRAQSRIGNVDDSERFKAEWVEKLNAGWHVDSMRAEAVFIHGLNEFEIEQVINEILGEMK